MTQLSNDNIAYICRLAKEMGGLSIPSSKAAFIEQRLARRMRALNYEDLQTYILSLQRAGAQSDQEKVALVEALATHTTSFFREPAQFVWLQSTALRELVEGGAGYERPLTIWSAACSFGAELYTAAIVVDRYVSQQPRTLRWQVVGSDLSNHALKRAESAIYEEEEIGGVPEELRRLYLLRSRQLHRNKELYRIVPALRQKARFFQVNLVKTAPPIENLVDVAFLRNVLIYFDERGRREAISNVTSKIRTGGYLLTGHAESLNPIPSGLKQTGPSIYQKV